MKIPYFNCILTVKNHRVWDMKKCHAIDESMDSYR